MSVASRPARPRRVLPWALFASLSVLLGASLWPDAPAPPPSVVGQAAPAFRLPRLDDPARTLGPADLQGQVWLLNVWASWCVACRQEHALLVALAREQKLPLYGLNHRDDPRAADEWLRRLGNPYVASLMDRDGQVGLDYGVSGVPETLVIDRAGVVRYRHVGPVTLQAWTQHLRPLLEALRG